MLQLRYKWVLYLICLMETDCAREESGDEKYPGAHLKMKEEIAMKRAFRKVAALLLVLLLTLPLLAGCGNEKEEAITEVGGTPVLEVNGVPVSMVDGVPLFHQYKSREVDLGLTEDETLYDVIEIDGELRATVGVLDPNYDPENPDAYIGKPYNTEHRWFSLDFEEDTARRERTEVYHEITFPADPTSGWVYGGEPMEDDWGKGIDYHFYRDGEIQYADMVFEDPLTLEMEDDIIHPSCYGEIAHFMVCDDVPFIAIDGGYSEDDGVVHRFPNARAEFLFIGERYINTWDVYWDYPEYEYRGLIGIAGKPFALLAVKDQNRDQGCLVPLTAEITSIIPDEGSRIKGFPTGGTFSDGRFGYFMSNTELWRTDGTNSECLIDLVPHGANDTSATRSVRALTDGRLLVSVDGKLIELSESDGTDAVTICNIAAIEYDAGIGDFSDLSLLLSKYNDQADGTFFRAREYEDAASLNLAILSGDVDMVITPNRLILKNYVKQELLAPLEEVVPALFEKDVLVESVVNAAKVDGVCYYLPTSFHVCGEYITDPSDLKDGKLFEDRVAYYDYIRENDPEYFKDNATDQILKTFANDLDEWIDWETSTCHFDDGTFAPLLELCALGCTEEEAYAYFNSKTSMEQWWGRERKAASFELEDGVESYRFTDVKSALDYQKEHPAATDRLGGPTTWVQVDFPIPSRVHEGYAIDAHNLYAIIDHEETKAACGDLLSWLILEDVIEEFPENDKDPYYATHRFWDGFPINKDETDRYLKRLIHSYLDPEAEAASVNPEAVKISPSIAAEMRYLAQDFDAKCGETQYEIAWEYINKADHLRYTDGDIFEVIRNEAEGFFTGANTAEKAADYIQNRISLYLAEQS